MRRVLDVARAPIALILAGALAAAGFEPLALWFLALPALAFLTDRAEAAPTPWRAALAGWLFGLGHFTAGNSWIATAFTYQAAMPAWLGWIAVVLLAGYLALYPALAAGTASLLAARARLAFVPAFAACWIGAEWLRATAFTGFAWNPLAMIALGGFDRPGLAHLAAWTGTYALSGLVLLLAGHWLFAWRLAHSRAWLPAAGFAAIPAVLMLLPWTGDGREGTLPYTLVQPNTRQDEINEPSLYEAQFGTLARLSLPTRPGATRLVLWPEGGVPDYLRTGYDRYWYEMTTFAADPVLARARIGRVIGPGSLLLTGAADLEQRNRQVVGAWNVITAVDAAGAIRGGYAKAHLVPYGEYLPMRDLLQPLGLTRLVSGTLDFYPGPGPRTIDFGPMAKGGWGRAGFQICYEIIFSGQVVDRRHRPDYIFNPSNDGWFGPAGPPQHLAQARMRAIEEGLPVLRSTTTGISAVIDADGVVRAFIPRHAAERRDGLVPPPHPPTLFARMGNALAAVAAVLLLVLAAVARRCTRRYGNGT